MAVLRFDERGVGESGGDFEGATSRDFSLDVEAALAYLRTSPEVDAGRLGLAGHGEGSMIAGMIAALEIVTQWLRERVIESADGHQTPRRERW